MQETIGDFWQMIAQFGTKTIIMLCDLFEGAKVVEYSMYCFCKRYNNLLKIFKGKMPPVLAWSRQLYRVFSHDNRKCVLLMDIICHDT